ncbi:MAG: thiamine biosynthesis protein, partial [Myxococcales bacterium]
MCPRPAPSSARSARSPVAPALTAIALALAACQRAPLGGSTGPGASSAASVGAAPADPIASGAPAAPAPTGPLWRDAQADPDDDLRLARLAEGEGASGLLDALDGPRRDLALAALPLTADADLAAGPLGSRLRAASPGELPAL